MLRRTIITDEDIENINKQVMISHLNRAACTVPKEEIALFHSLVSGGTMLDIGCFDGRLAPYFTEKNMNYQGIDFCVEAVSKAKYHHAPISFQVMNARRLEFLSQSFHATWSCCAFSMMTPEMTREALAEMHRVLRSNGISVVVLPLNLEEGYHELIEDQGFYSLWSIQDFEKELLDAGFTSVEVTMNYEEGAMTFVAKKIR